MDTRLGLDSPYRSDRNSQSAGLCCEAFDRLALPMVITGADATIVFMNMAAHEIVGRQDGLLVQRNRPDGTARLAAHARGDDLRLVAEIERASCCEAGPRGVSITRPAGGRPYIVQIAPLAPCTQGASPRGAMAVVAFVVDLEIQCRLDDELLRSTFGLTKAESSVARALVGSETLGRIARRTGVAVSTLRTHLRSLFEKTGTRRQAELVRMLTALGVFRSV